MKKKIKKSKKVKKNPSEKISRRKFFNQSAKTFLFTAAYLIIPIITGKSDAHAVCDSGCTSSITVEPDPCTSCTECTSGCTASCTKWCTSGCCISCTESTT